MAAFAYREPEPKVIAGATGDWEMVVGLARKVRIERIHLEQDAGKSVYDLDPARSFVDLNRTDGDRLSPRHPRPRGGGGIRVYKKNKHPFS